MSTLGSKVAQTVPLSDYEVYAVQAGTTRAAVLTGSDSCHIYIEISINGTDWVKLTGVTPKCTGGAVYLITDNLVTTTTNGTAVWDIEKTYPFIRCVYQHYKASCTMYPAAKLLTKKL